MEIRGGGGGGEGGRGCGCGCECGWLWLWLTGQTPGQGPKNDDDAPRSHANSTSSRDLAPLPPLQNPSNSTNYQPSTTHTCCHLSAHHSSDIHLFSLPCLQIPPPLSFQSDPWSFPSANQIQLFLGPITASPSHALFFAVLDASCKFSNAPYFSLSPLLLRVAAVMKVV